MEIKVTLSLPRDEISIPVVRRICAQSMSVLGVTRECIDDIEVAITEACANVLLHARDEDEYEVSAGIDGHRAVVEVTDRGGPGFDPATAAGTDSGEIAETGRGIQLMRALVDEVHFVSGHGNGTVVHLEKELRWEPDAPIEQLSKTQLQRSVWHDSEPVATPPVPPTR